MASALSSRDVFQRVRQPKQSSSNVKALVLLGAWTGPEAGVSTSQLKIKEWKKKNEGREC